jgi:hypothetical protein
MPPSLAAVTRDADQYQQYLSSLQRLRAQTYLEDGAIQPEQIDPSGRFPMHQDEDCWHFLLIDTRNDVVGCVRYLAHSPAVAFENLWVRQSPLVQDPLWGPRLQRAVEADLSCVRELNLRFTEIGGWTIHSDYRHTRAAFELVLGSFAWSHLVGAGIGCATATVRNNSSGILRRIGGTSYESDGLGLPAYYDGSYGCAMEILRFQFGKFAPRFLKVVEDIRLRLVDQSTIQSVSHCCDDASDQFRTTENLQALERVLKSAGAPQNLSSPELIPTYWTEPLR